jgi:hypothetical protein
MEPPKPGLTLIGQRDLRSINSWTHNVSRLARSQSPTLRIHHDDAREHSISDGDLILRRSASGSVEVVPELTEDIAAGTVGGMTTWCEDGFARFFISQRRRIHIRITEHQHKLARTKNGSHIATKIPLVGSISISLWNLPAHWTIDRIRNSGIARRGVRRFAGCWSAQVAYAGPSLTGTKAEKRARSLKHAVTAFSWRRPLIVAGGPDLT